MSATGKEGEIRNALSLWKGEDHHTVKYFDEICTNLQEARADVKRLEGDSTLKHAERRAETAEAQLRVYRSAVNNAIVKVKCRTHIPSKIEVIELLEALTQP